MRFSHLLPALAPAAFLSGGAWAQTPPGTHEVSYLWGGETRQVFTREVDTGTQVETHVWTVGDGALIRHAVDPQGDDWEVQSPPSGTTQTLLDVYFLPDGEKGWACGVGGHVIKTDDGGATWEDQAPILENALGTGEDATLWRVRMIEDVVADYEVGFTLGLWTFLRWNGSAWSQVSLEDQNHSPLNVAEFEFYALDIIVDPQDSTSWIGIAAGQKWSSPGGGAGKIGAVFYTNSNTHNGGTLWTRVLETTDLVQGPKYGDFDDPWDFEYERNPAQYDEAVGYLCGGTIFDSGFVYRCTQSGLVWDTVPELSGINPPAGSGVNTIYGISVLDAERAVAVSYGGMIWSRDPSTDPVWTRVAPEPTGCGITVPPSPAGPCRFTGPLAGAHSSSEETFAVGSFGYLKSSPDQFTSVPQDLNTASSENQTEQLRLTDVHFVDETEGFATGANRAIADLDQGGHVLDLVFGGPSAYGASPPLLAIEFNTAGTGGVAVGPGGTFQLGGGVTAQGIACYSTNSGSTWTTSAIPSLLSGLDLTAARLDNVCWAPGRNAFFAAGTYKNALNQTQPLLLASPTGNNWSNANVGLTPIPAGTILTGVDFGTGQVGFCVGYDEATGAPRAYKLDFANASAPISAISPTSGEPLRAVSTNGTVTYAVGDGERVYRYAGSGVMTQVTTPDLIPGGLIKLNLISVAVAPEADFVLVGAEQPADEAEAPGLGKLLMYNGTRWTTLPSLTDKYVRSIQLRSSDSGWLVSRSDDLDPEFGMVADSMLLRFLDVR